MPGFRMITGTTRSDSWIDFTGKVFYFGDAGTDALTYDRQNETQDIEFTWSPTGVSVFQIGGLDDVCVESVEQFFIETGWGNDRITTGFSADTVKAHWGRDILDLGAGNDKGYGGQGSDILYGQSGSDDLFGGSGNDALYGGDDEDTLDAGSGENFLFGGGGADIFRFRAANGSEDVIEDFQPGFDKISMKGVAIFEGEEWRQIGFDDLEIDHRDGVAHIDYGGSNDELEVRGDRGVDVTLTAEDFIFE